MNTIHEDDDHDDDDHNYNDDNHDDNDDDHVDMLDIIPEVRGPDPALHCGCENIVIKYLYPGDSAVPVPVPVVLLQAEGPGELGLQVGGVDLLCHLF